MSSFLNLIIALLHSVYCLQESRFFWNINTSYFTINICFNLFHNIEPQKYIIWFFFIRISAKYFNIWKKTVSHFWRKSPKNHPIPHDKILGPLLNTLKICIVIPAKTLKQVRYIDAVFYL